MPGSASSLTVPKALDIAKENSDIPPTVSQYLERKKTETWARLQQDPSHVMDKNEYMVMSYYCPEYSHDPQYAAAIQRFWQNYQGDPADVDGVRPASSTSR